MKKDSEVVFLQGFPTGFIAKMVQDLLQQHGIKTLYRTGDLDVAQNFTTCAPADLWVLKRDYRRAKKILKLYFESEEEERGGESQGGY